jgi:hypothetical protein
LKSSDRQSKESTVNLTLKLDGLPLALKLKNAKSDAKTIYSMVTKEQGTMSELKNLVTHESIYQLIMFCFDLAIKSGPIAQGRKSRQKATKESIDVTQRLYQWLDKNIHKYPRLLKRCYIDARDELKIDRSLSWIEKKVTEYKKQNSKPTKNIK